MGMTKYKSWKSVDKEFPKKSCTEGVSTVQHEKMMPNCKNVTKLNCVTLWKTDENGKQVGMRLVFVRTHFKSFFHN